MSDTFSVSVATESPLAVTIDGDSVSVVDSETTVGVSMSVVGQARELFKRKTFTGDGSTTDFELDFTPRTNSERVWLQGILQDKDTEYSLSDKTISFNTAPKTGRKIEVWYVKE